jgi:hypothetical protein
MDKQEEEKNNNNNEIIMNCFILGLNHVWKMFCDIKFLFILIILLFITHVYSNEGHFSTEKRLQYK